MYSEIKKTGLTAVKLLTDGGSSETVSVSSFVASSIGADVSKTKCNTVLCNIVKDYNNTRRFYENFPHVSWYYHHKFCRHTK